MKEEGSIWMNGNLVPFKDAKVHVLTHALHYSTAVFEGLRCYSTEKGPAIFRLGEHVDRLFNSAKMYSMEMPYSKDEITEAIIQTVRKSGLHECYIRPIAYYGYGEMGLTPTKNKVDVSNRLLGVEHGRVGGGQVYRGQNARYQGWVRMDSRVQPVKAKAASNYANAALARLEAIDCGYDEAIMLKPRRQGNRGQRGEHLPRQGRQHPPHAAVRVGNSRRESPGTA